MNSLKQMNDELLLSMLADGSSVAFEELYVRYKKRLHTFCLFLLKSPDRAADIVHDIFAMIWDNRRSINAHQSFSSYLYTVARNKSLNELRDIRSKEEIDILHADQRLLLTDESGETALILHEYETLLRQAIALLPEERRRIYRMSREDGLTYKDIGKCLGISPHTVQAHISSSVQFIRSYFLQHANVSLLATSSVFLANL